MGPIFRAVLVFAAIVGGALAMTVLGPSKPDTDKFSSATDKALMVAELNEISAEGAPQQAVVNGWVARDLAVVHAEQNTALIEEQAKTNQLLFVAIVTGSIFLAGIGAKVGARHAQPSLSAGGVAPFGQGALGPPSTPAVSGVGTAVPPAQGPGSQVDSSADVVDLM